MVLWVISHEHRELHRNQSIHPVFGALHPADSEDIDGDVSTLHHSRYQCTKYTLQSRVVGTFYLQRKMYIVISNNFQL